MKKSILKNKILLTVLAITFLSESVLAHSLKPSPINYPDYLTEQMCNRTKEIREIQNGTRETMKLIDDKNSRIKNLLTAMYSENNQEEVDSLIEANRENYSPIFNLKFRIYREQVDILESTCMGDDGYYFIKTSELRELITEYNKNVEKYEKFLTNELLSKVEEMKV